MKFTDKEILLAASILILASVERAPGSIHDWDFACPQGDGSSIPCKVLVGVGSESSATVEAMLAWAKSQALIGPHGIATGSEPHG